MIRSLSACGAVLAAVLAAAGIAWAPPEKADQVKRDAARLEQVKMIALAPVVIQLRMEKIDRIPDPNRMAARMAVATRMPGMLEEQMGKGKYKVLPYEASSLIVKQMNWKPVDLFVTNVKGSWESPSEILRNAKGDEVLLLNKHADMKQAPEQMTLFRYKWHDLPDMAVGLAGIKDMTFAVADTEKLKALGEKVGADAAMFVQVEDMETHESAAGLFSEPFKSTRIHLHGTLVSAADGAVLWQAHARGVKSQKAGFFTGNRAYGGEDRKAIEGAAQALDLLLEDLYYGSGKPWAKGG